MNHPRSDDDSERSDCNTEYHEKRKGEDDLERVPNNVIVLSSDEDDEGINQPSTAIEQQKQDAEMQSVQAKKNDKELHPAVAVDSDLAQDGILGEDANGSIDIGDMWKLAFLYRDPPVDKSSNDDTKETEEEQLWKCDHQYILKDDIGCVCRVCGIIDKPICEIIEIPCKKASNSRRCYPGSQQSWM